MTTVHVLTVHDWLPPPAARMNRAPPRIADRLRRSIDERVSFEAVGQRVPKATGPRRVHVHLVAPTGPGFPGADLLAVLAAGGLLKEGELPAEGERKAPRAVAELLDALALAGLLVDAAPPWCLLAVTCAEGPTRRTVITLEDALAVLS